MIFIVVVCSLAALAYYLGQWQFHRLDERQARNEIVRTNLQSPPLPIAQTPGDDDVNQSEEWHTVTATGHYAPEKSIVVRYRTQDGHAGVNIVVPLRTSSGRYVAVDRGWMATDNQGLDTVDAPEPPTGEVTVHGWLRRNATGDSTSVSSQSTRAISSDAIGEALGIDMYDGFVEATKETPPPETALRPEELPELDDGPHFFYGLQWWFFGVLAVFGFCYLAYDEWKRGPRGQRPTRGKKPQPVPSRAS